jgi:hypothetical protein
MLRWFWWRINAWSEISAMVASGIVSLFLQSKAAAGFVEVLRKFDPALPSGALDGGHPHGFAWLMILTTGLTTITWLVVTFATAPESEDTLRTFYLKVQPSSIGWKPIAKRAGLQSTQSLSWSLVDWVLGCAMLYCALFGLGHIIFHRYAIGIALLFVSAACLLAIFWDLNRRGWESLR